jgi:hypothetical protein
LREEGEGPHGGSHLAQGLANEPLLVERGDDDRDPQYYLRLAADGFAGVAGGGGGALRGLRNASR